MTHQVDPDPTSATAVTRASVIDVDPAFVHTAEDPGRPTVVTARSRELRTGADGSPHLSSSIDLQATIDPDRTLVAVEVNSPTSLVDALATLVGRRVASGFRAALASLTGSDEGRRLRRILWDFPIITQVASQTMILDHPAARADFPLSLAGVDQCSGWRAHGEMLTQIEDSAGILRMRLGPPPEVGALTEPWADVPAVVAMTTRRARATTVWGGATPGAIVRFRDSYADPDGIERALHEWVVTLDLDALSGQIIAIEALAGELPWGECPWAGLSAGALAGRRPDEVESLVAADLRGTSTCTHLNDTLRSLAELPDLLASLRRP